MEIILHIGMGKTGTSSIQAALNSNSDNLRAQGLDYLGMWFDLIDPSLNRDDVQRNYFKSSVDRSERLADIFVNALRKKQSETGISRFLLSNESLLQQHPSLIPFIACLRQEVPVRLISYARDPRDWLPSAYNQWFVYHKTCTGPIPPYAEGGNSLLKMYDDLNAWLQAFNDIMIVRPFSKSINVVQDFASVLDVNMTIPEERTFERVEISESLLRAIYNNPRKGMVLPDRFNHVFRHLDFTHSPSIASLLRDKFNYEQTNAIVAEHVSTFEEIKKRSGIDLISEPAPAQKSFNQEEISQRALEHVLQIVMQQADRISHLEHIVKKLETENKDQWSS